MNEARRIPRIVIAGISSGSGKTTLTVALCRALVKRGLRVSSFKAGPDYLDPTYHARATGSVSQNLDAWMMGREAVLSTFASAAANADIAVVEGVMGLFDGVGPRSDEGSTAQTAKWLSAPVLLVLDASGMARTAAALVQGCVAFDPELEVAGVICNRLGSKNHLQILRDAVESAPVVGGLPKESSLSFPERHLGLRTAEHDAVSDAQIDAWAELLEQWCDVDAVVRMAENAVGLPIVETMGATPKATEASCRIGYALDAAFHFYYEDNLRRLRALGATLVPFSPIADAQLPDVDGLYFGGGYPEIHAKALAANESMRAAVRAFADDGGPIYAECGGLMYLCSGIRTTEDTYEPMVGLLPAEAVMHKRLQALGYVDVETTRDSVLGPVGQHFRGHQFRYSELRWTGEASESGYLVIRKRTGASEPEGYCPRPNVLASYVHAHWASNPGVAENFVRNCHRHMTRREGRDPGETRTRSDEVSRRFSSDETVEEVNG